MKALIACGLMSGTSRDGIDAALVRIGGRFPDNQVRLLYTETRPYPRWLRDQLERPWWDFTAMEAAALDFAVGEAFARAALGAVKRAGLKPGDVAFVGSHGQTLLHAPRGAPLGPRKVRSTLQVGSGAVIAQATGITTVSDFRSADIAVGGEGAPLVPVYDYVVLRSEVRNRVALNVGGIANLTAIPRSAAPNQILSFDTGPGNCMVDTAVRLLTRGRLAFDRGGRLAMRGSPDLREVRRILGHPYFPRRPPKSTGWEEFGEAFTRPLVRRMQARGACAADIVSTLTHAVCDSIAHAISDFVFPRMPVDEIVIAGGGTRNRAITGGLGERLPTVRVLTGEDVGIASGAKEACAFAYLAYLCLAGIAANLASQAAGLEPAVLGAVYRGRPRRGSPKPAGQ